MVQEQIHLLVLFCLGSNIEMHSSPMSAGTRTENGRKELETYGWLQEVHIGTPAYAGCLSPAPKHCFWYQKGLSHVERVSLQEGKHSRGVCPLDLV